MVNKIERYLKIIEHLNDYEVCPGCGEKIFEPGTFPFCMRCGTINHYYDPQDFEKNWGEKLEDYIERECRADHPGHRQEIWDDHEDFKIFPYCGVCGKLLFVTN